MKKKSQIKIGAAILITICLVSLYFLTPLKEYTNVDKIIEVSKNAPDGWLTFGLFLAIFFFGGVLFTPIPLITFASGLIFGVWKGLAVSFIGLILASTSGYLLGKLLGTDFLGNKINKHLDKFNDNIDDKGAMAVIALRLAPTPPFTVTSILSGSINLNYIKYLGASVLGIAPLALSATFFGKGAIKLMQKPSSMAITMVAASIILYITYYLLKKKHKSEEND